VPTQVPSGDLPARGAFRDGGPPDPACANAVTPQALQAAPIAGDAAPSAAAAIIAPGSLPDAGLSDPRTLDATARDPAPLRQTGPAPANPDAPPVPASVATSAAPKPPTPLARSTESALLLRAADQAPPAADPADSPRPATSASPPPPDRPAPCEPGLPALEEAGTDRASPDQTAREPARQDPDTAFVPRPAADSARDAQSTPAALRDLPAPTVPALVVSASRPEIGPVEVILTPEDLGRLRFELTQTGEQVRIHLTVERPETLDLLRRHADHLLAEFRQAGYAGASLSFGSWTQGGQPPAPPAPPPDPQPPPPAAPRTPNPSQGCSPGSGLDLRL